VISGALTAVNSEWYAPIFSTQVKTFLQLIVFFWIGSNVLRNDGFSRKVLLTYGLAVCFLSVAVKWGLPGFTQDVKTYIEGQRFSALNLNSNYLGFVLALAIVILTGMALDKKRRREFFVIPVITVLIMLVQTGSRGSMLALAAGISCYLIPLKANRRKVVAVLVVGCLLAGFGYLILSNPTVVTRWMTTINEGNSSRRDELVAHSLAMITERPLLGWGPITGPIELGQRFKFGYAFGDGEDLPDSHNLELTILVQNGILGGGLFLAGLVFACISAWKHRTGGLGILPFALVVTLIVDLQTCTFNTSKPLWLMMAVFAGTSGFAGGRKGARLSPARWLRAGDTRSQLPYSHSPSHRFR
jgi:O-antigen ligase